MVSVKAECAMHMPAGNGHLRSILSRTDPERPGAIIACQRSSSVARCAIVAATSSRERPASLAAMVSPMAATRVAVAVTPASSGLLVGGSGVGDRRGDDGSLFPFTP